VKRKALGRGLSALIPETPEPSAREGTPPDYFLCPIELIKPGKDQPRKFFDEEKLQELVGSIRQQGVIQPLVVRPLRGKQPTSYVLVAGERRWRAAQKAGLHEVPVVIRKVNDQQALELALVENLQREDLNPVEEAEAIQRLLQDHGQTQEQLARRLGRDRSTVTNSLRLLKLPAAVRKALVAGAISAGHARSLLALEGQPRLMTRALSAVLQGELSVRQTEVLVKRLKQPEQPRPAADSKLSANVRDLQQRLTRSLKTRVRLKPGQRGHGRIEINYSSLDELDRLLELLLR
jgi:ParB family chromosome partitioning protein